MFNEDTNMTFDEYHEAAMRTSILPDAEAHIQYGVLNTASEAGEVAGKFAKALRDGHSIDHKEVIKELGDVLWSMTALCEGLGVPLSEVAKANINKLQSRQQRDVIGGSGDNR